MASTQYTASLVTAETNNVVIDADEFERAGEDPAVRSLHEEADAFHERLQREKRDF